MYSASEINAANCNIICRNRDELVKMLKYLEDNGFTWRSGTSPTSFHPPLSDDRDDDIVVLDMDGEKTFGYMHSSVAVFDEFIADKHEFAIYCYEVLPIAVVPNKEQLLDIL